MPHPRNHGHGNGPARIPSYGHRYGLLHDRILSDDRPDDTFYSKVSNRDKTNYVCQTLRITPNSFHLDLPLPFEDWALSDDMSLLNAGLFVADMRRQFYEALMTEHKELRDSPAFANHADAEFWNHEFNRLIAKRKHGVHLPEPRILN